jgi:mannitol 2-dehydrogenase
VTESSPSSVSPTPLSAATLADLGPEVARPQYDRAQVSVGIVHFGVGAFHRTHQAMYLDTLMNDGQALDWGICGVGVLPSDQKMKTVMDAQDHLYTMVIKHPDGTFEPRVIGSIVDYLFAPDDPDAVIERMTDPAVRIVSLTVTEGGYNIHAVTGQFDVSNPDVIHDAAPGAVPRTVFGLITEALRRRWERGLAPFVVMSCDNIPGNGEVARSSLAAFARLRDAGLAERIETEVQFPNAMVDRITPATTDDDRAEVARRFGIADGWPVVCEPFTQWVLEDWDGERPAYENVGVQLVADVGPYELMKLRLLNGSHQALCYLGYLAGYRYAHEVCQDPLFAEFLLAYMDTEATPTLAPVPGIDLAAYKPNLIERFSNPQVRDTLARLCMESSDRIPKWLLPVIRENLASGGPIALTATVVASWARYSEAIDEQGEPIVVVDRLRDTLIAAAQAQTADPLSFVRNRELFGDLVDDPQFTSAYLAALDSLHAHGARKTLEHLLA